jgi:hypothetical protein
MRQITSCRVTPNLITCLFLYDRITIRYNKSAHVCELDRAARQQHGPDLVSYAESGVCVRELKGCSHSVRLAVFSPDGKQIASASDDNTVRSPEYWHMPKLSFPMDLDSSTMEMLGVAANVIMFGFRTSLCATPFCARDRVPPSSKLGPPQEGTSCKQRKPEPRNYRYVRSIAG